MGALRKLFKRTSRLTLDSSRLETTPRTKNNFPLKRSAGSALKRASSLSTIAKQPTEDAETPIRLEAESPLRVDASRKSPTSLFETLPLDIIFCIMKFLPTISAAALALCSKNTLAKLGTVYFEMLAMGKFQLTDWILRDPIPTLLPLQTARQEFLILLERDIEGMVFCHFCQKLHSPELFDIDFKGPTGKECLAPRSNVLLNYHLGELHHGRMRNLMKSCRLEPDSSRVIAQLSKTVTTYHQMTHQVSLSARIISGTFYLRAQHRIPLLETSPPQIPDADYLANFCFHNRTFKVSLDTTPTGLTLKRCVQCHLSNYPDLACPRCSKVMTCRRCHTEFQTEVRKLGNGRLVLVVTAWQDLGELLTPFDPKWMCRFQINHGLDVSFRRGSLKKIFEETRPDSIATYQEDFTEEAEAALFKSTHSLSLHPDVITN